MTISGHPPTSPYLPSETSHKISRFSYTFLANWIPLTSQQTAFFVSLKGWIEDVVHPKTLKTSCILQNRFFLPWNLVSFPSIPIMLLRVLLTVSLAVNAPTSIVVQAKLGGPVAKKSVDKLSARSVPLQLQNIPLPTPTVAPAPAPIPISSSIAPSGVEPRLHFYGISPPPSVLPLQDCQGHCTTDADCASGLICYERQQYDPVPGCNGTDPSKTNYCINPNVNGIIDINPTTRTIPITYVPPSPTPYPKYGGQPQAPQVPHVGTPSPSAPTDFTNFRLKEYWEPGYFWQCETFERKWCMYCRNYKCKLGDQPYITTCSENVTYFDFIPVTAETVLIKLAGENLCFGRYLARNITLQYCDSENTGQQWFANNNGSFSDYRFEISPLTRQDYCITTRHQPKNDENVHLEPCTVARYSYTSNWNRF